MAPLNDWKDRAPCTGKRDIFFGRSRRIEVARRMCAPCRFNDACFWTCMADEEPNVQLRFGVWAGTTAVQRQEVHVTLGSPGREEYERRRDEAVAALRL